MTPGEWVLGRGVRGRSPTVGPEKFIRDLTCLKKGGRVLNKRA